MERIKERKQRNNKKKGFTLIELMIVLGLIGVLVGFMVPKMAAYKEKALETKAVNTAKQVENAVIACRSTNSTIDETAVEKYTGKKPDSVIVKGDDEVTVGFKSDKKAYAEVIDLKNNSFTLHKDTVTGGVVYTSGEETENNTETTK